MAKAELGMKRRCLSCGAAFFDLNRERIVCPKCGAVFQVVALQRSEPRRAFYRLPASDGTLGQDQAENDGGETVTAHAEAESVELDEGVIEPTEEEDRIEEIDHFMSGPDPV